MSRRDIVLQKLHGLPDEVVKNAIAQLTHHVKARMRYRSLLDRTRTGAHGQKNLGMSAIDYYVGEAIKRLYDPSGWDWQFEKYTLQEQLIRIANKLISDKVDKFKTAQNSKPSYLDNDVSDIAELQQIDDSDVEKNEDIYLALIQFAHDVSKDDDDLHYFVLRYFEKASLNTIAEEMMVDIEKVYALKKKLVRRLMNYKEKLTA